jgi:phosphoribosylglycinamide formyltransferase 1
MFKVAVLSSGMSRGSNLRAMAEYFRDNHLPVQISFVVRTQIQAQIAEVCNDLSLNCIYLSSKDMDQLEEKVLFLIQYHGINLIALAGFMKKLSPGFIRKTGVPILNIHPALLPKYGGQGMFGLAVHKAVFEAGDKISGATVHFVDSVYDHGKILTQQSVNISTCKTPEDIATRVLDIEHQLYGRTIWTYLQKLYS